MSTQEADMIPNPTRVARSGDHTRRGGWGRSVVLACALAAAGLSLSGCIVAPAGPGWCYYHPYRCR